MCGSLLSKFSKCGNKVAPKSEADFEEPNPVGSKTKWAEETTRSPENNPNVAKKENFQGESEIRSSLDRETGSVSEDLSEKQEDAERRALDSAKAILSTQRSTISNDPATRAMQSAKEILEAQMDSTPLGSSTIAYQHASSTRSVFMGETPNAIAFEVLDGYRPTVRPTARVLRRLNKLERQPKPSRKQINAKLLAAEERKLRELENIRTRASSRAGSLKPHPAEAVSKATAKKIAVKQAAADRNRNEMIAIKKQSGIKASRKRNKIATAQVAAREDLQSAIGRKMKKSKDRKAEQNYQRYTQKNLREERARKVRENIEYMLLEEEKEVLEDLREIEADQAYCASDSDESWGKSENEVAYAWEDFFNDDLQ